MEEKKGPHITVTPLPFNSSGGSIRAISATSCFKSIYEIKTVLPQSEEDDSRPILYRENHGLPGYSCIMGGKFDNIYDVLKELELIMISLARLADATNPLSMPTLVDLFGLYWYVDVVNPTCRVKCRICR